MEWQTDELTETTLGSDERPSILELATMLGRAHRAAEAAVDAKIRCVGLNAAQLRALKVIVDGEGTAWTVGKLAGVLDLHHTTASHVVGALEARGFVQRSADDSDRRRTVVELTPRGAGRVVRAMRVIEGCAETPDRMRQ